MSRNNLSIFKVLLAAISTTWLFRILSVVSALIIFPLLISHLGKKEFGIWVLVGQVVSFLTLSDIGITTAVGRLVARFRGQNDSEVIDRLLSTVFVLLTAAGLLVAIITLLISPWIPGLLAIERNYAGVTRLIFTISGLSLAAQFPLRIGMGILTGHQLYGPHGIGKILNSILYLLGVLVLCGLNNLNLVSLTLAAAAATLIAQIVLIIVAWRMTGPWAISPRNLSSSIVREVMSLGFSTLTTSFTKLTYQKGIGVIIGRLLGLEAVGIYGIALSVIDSVRPFIAAFATPFTTLASELQTAQRLAHLRKTSNLVMRVTAAMAGCISAGLFIYSEPVLRLWLARGDWTSDDFSQAGKTIAIMGLGLAIALPQVVSRSILQGVGQHWQVTWRNMLASFMSILASIFAIYAGLGIPGAALAWSLGQLLQCCFYLPMSCCYLEQSVGKTAFGVYSRAVAVGMIVLIAAWVCRILIVPDTILRLLIGVLGCSMFGCAVVLLTSGQSGALWARLRPGA
jgi:O-antigen/teichoic acid export membrane protein